MTEGLSGRLVEGVFVRALGPELSDGLKASLAEVGLDVRHLSREATYALDVWERALRLAAAAMFPAATSAAQLHQLGRRLAAALEERRVLRGAWLGVARLVGPRRALTVLAPRLREGSMRVAVTAHDAEAALVELRAPGPPEFLSGLLEGACVLLGSPGCRVCVVASAATHTSLRVTWR